MTPALEVDDLAVHFGGIVALDSVSLTVPSGGLHGLIGPNGAGKTTFLDAVSGFVRLAGGTVAVDGIGCTGLAPHRIARLGLARTFQSLELFDDLSVGENLAVVAAATPATARAPVPSLPPAGTTERVDAALDAVGLTGGRDRRPPELSNVDRRRVALARALVARPTIVLLDEPAAGLDPAETTELAAQLRRITATGTAVLLVEHDMELVLGACEVVHVLDGGRLVAKGAPEEIRRHPDVLRAYLGVT